MEPPMTNPDDWEVVVVGAGPAGSVTARELARRGVRVLLVDKATFPRPKVCGCCLNRATLAALDAVGLGHVLAKCGAVPLTGVKLAAGRVSADVRLPGGMAVSREAFDAALVEEAVKAGATFRPGTVWRTGEVGFPLAKVTVLACGLAGNTGRAARSSRIGAGVVVPESLAPPFYVPGTIYMATGHGGYVGLVRLEDNQLDVAAALDPVFVRLIGGPGAAAGAILAETGWPAMTGIESLPWKGTPALTRTPERIAGPGWFAVGDAAGYVEPFTGEGMAWAVTSAAALAPIAARAAAGWNDSLAGQWARTHRRLVGRRQQVCRWVVRGLRSPLATRLAVRVLSVLPFLSRPLVSALNRPPLLILSHGPSS
jgi:flavin-dependent dehydrogenase